MLVVLCFTFLLASLAYLALAQSQSKTKVSSELARVYPSEALADSGYDLARLTLYQELTRQVNAPKPRFNGTTLNLEVGRDQLILRFVDADSLINPYGLGAPLLAAVLPRLAACGASVPPNANDPRQKLPTIEATLAVLGIDPGTCAPFFSQSGRAGMIRLANLPAELLELRNYLPPGVRETDPPSVIALFLTMQGVTKQ